MKQTLLLVTCVLAAAVAHAQPSFVDLYNEDYNPTIGYRVNDGQVIDTDENLRSDVLAKSEGTPFTIWPCENSRVSFSWRTPDSLLHRVDVRTIGELSSAVDPTFRDVRPGHHNYYYPHTAPNGAEEVLSYSRIDYSDIYPDIDLILYSGSGGPKMAYVCRPGSDPANILLQFQGQDSLKVDSINGELRAYLDSGELLLPYVIAYQWDSNNNVDTVGWTPSYREDNSGDQISFEFDTYDTNEPLVFLIGMPPPPPPPPPANNNLVWSTTVGGDNADIGGDNDDFIWGSDVGDDGSLFVAGHTASDYFPANTGSQPSGLGTDVFVSHYLYNPGNPDDAALDWTTFLGGSGQDKAQALHVADNGDVCVVGWTNSEDMVAYPIADPADGTYWESQLKGTEDGIILKLEPLQGNVLHAATFGGDGVDILTAITEDGDGNVYIGGNTTSEDGPGVDCDSPSSGMPLCDPGSGAYYETANAGGLDVIVLRLDPDFHMTWGTFWGTAEDDRVFDMAPTYSAVGVANGFAMVGQAQATIPAGPNTGYQQAGNGDVNGYVATFNTNGVQQWSTNLHGLNDLQAVTSNTAGRLVVAGTHVIDPNPAFVASCTAVSNSLCICDPGNGAEINSTSAGGSDNYIAEFSMPSGTLVWGTLIGGSTDEYPVDNMDVSGSLDGQVTSHYRNMDLEMAPNGEFYFMGISGYFAADPQITYPEVVAWGHYLRPAVPVQSSYQTDVSLHRFTATRALGWASLYGASEETTGNVLNDQIDHITHGSDYGHDMALNPYTTIYWTGSTGTHGFEDHCPTVGGASYCETQPLFFVPGQFDGFIARMNLTGINVGLNDATGIATADLTMRPNGSDAWNVFLDGSALLNTTIGVYDATGRFVLSTTTDATGTLYSHKLANGHYTLVAPSEKTCRAVSFVIAR
jgi:hypothetical protein